MFVTFLDLLTEVSSGSVHGFVMHTGAKDPVISHFYSASQRKYVGVSHRRNLAKHALMRLNTCLISQCLASYAAANSIQILDLI